ncbi:hypothetical protein AB9N12_05720 [Bacteroides sp. AN502(2024)]|uniref:hypothetical protein n=1 Tax=Bacteroides sp. AN502(2024) TaxID=3160599 RepID=UPI0035159088
MNNIIISNFKGIEHSIELDFSILKDGISIPSNNMVLYSENGGGKTSIAEAIRLMAFRTEFENSKIAPYIVGEEREAAKRDWLNNFLHNQSTESFEIEIDGMKFSDWQPDIISNVLILGRSQLIPTSKINLAEILDTSYFGSSHNLSELLSADAVTLILDEVNEILNTDFKEQISLALPETGENIVGINGVIDGLLTENIDEKLNEAQQNLIKILLFLNYIKLLPRLDMGKKYFIVIDDIMSSLDLANRIILARFLTKLGLDNQMLIMTHNVGFYNLMKHLVCVENSTEKWSFKSLYKIDGKHTICPSNDECTVDELVKRFDGHILPNNDLAINAMRRKFEKLLHEFGKILILGVQDETINIIQKISSIGNEYYCNIEGNKIKTHIDLLRELSSIIDVCPQEQLQSKIRKLFLRYDNGNNMPWIADVIKHLHTFQKVIFHQGSHDQIGIQPVISAKEITMSLELMKRLELIVNRSSSNYPYFM